MKTKIILLFTALLFISTGSFAEDDDDKVGGIRAGWQYSGLYNSGTILEGTDPLNSFYVGFFRENKLFPLLALGTGLEYFQVGVIDSELDDTSLKLHYISIPIDIRVKLGPVYALGGVAANFKVGEKWKILGEDFTPEDDFKAEFFDVPLFLGVGVKIMMIRIEARYHWGMLDTYKSVDGSDAIKGQYLQIGAGISF